MHVILGALIIVGTFLWAMQYMTMDFDGFFNMYAMILLSGVPLGLMVVTFPFSTIFKAVQGLGSAIFSNPNRERERLAQKVVAFAREVRRERGVAASSILESEKDPVFRHLGRLVLQGSTVEEIEADAVVIGRRQLEPWERGERVFSALGDFAPAMGMIGTVIGLINLLANMRDFDKLGPGMAIALLTTFYGLMLAHLLYLPLARLIADHGRRRTENINLVIESMLKLARRRPVHEVEDLLGIHASMGGSSQNPAVARGA